MHSVIDITYDCTLTCLYLVPTSSICLCVFVCVYIQYMRWLCMNCVIVPPFVMLTIECIRKKNTSPPPQKTIVLLVTALIVQLLVTLHMPLNHQHSGLESPKHLIISPPTVNHESRLACLEMCTMFLKMLYLFIKLSDFFLYPCTPFQLKRQQ